ncbi:MAG: hypothetical protein RSG96_03955 [Clostridia bacterium]
MAGISNKVKLAWLKGMEAIGKGASNMANSAHDKVAEINLESRRREILGDFPMRAFDLWQKGVELPEPLGSMMAELGDLDQRLSVLRAQRYAMVEENSTNVAATDTEKSDAASGAGESEAEKADLVEETDAATEDASPAREVDAAPTENDASEEHSCCDRLDALMDGELLTKSADDPANNKETENNA